MLLGSKNAKEKNTNISSETQCKSSFEQETTHRCKQNEYKNRKYNHKGIRDLSKKIDKHFEEQRTFIISIKYLKYLKSLQSNVEAISKAFKPIATSNLPRKIKNRALTSNITAETSD